MKQIYTLTALCFVLLFFTQCSKDVLKSYERRIIGTWKVRDVDRYGFGRSNNLPFSEDGVFTFADNGRLTYNYRGVMYRGSWDIRRDYYEEDNIKSLHITVIDFNSQQVLSEYFDKITFTGTNRFNAVITSNVRTYVFRFSRQ